MRYLTQPLLRDLKKKLVLNLNRPQERRGVKVLPLGQWLEALAPAPL